MKKTRITRKLVAELVILCIIATFMPFQMDGTGFKLGNTIKVKADVQMLDPVTNLTFNNDGKVTWTAVENVQSYTLYLYLNGLRTLTFGIASSVTELNVLQYMRICTGTYSVGIAAIGDGVNYLSSSEVKSDSQTVVRLDTVTEMSWSGNTAKWTSITDAVSYDVALYKDGIGTGILKNVLAANASAGCDFSSDIAALGYGIYTFTVKAKGNTTLILDGNVSTTSEQNIYYVKAEKTVFDLNHAADLNFTILNTTDSLEQIYEGEQKLVEDTDYTISNDQITFSKDYLKNHSVGNLPLTFYFSNLKNETVNITIQKSTPTSTVTTNPSDSSIPVSYSRTGTMGYDDGNPSVAINIVRTATSDGLKKDTVSLTEAQENSIIEIAAAAGSNSINIEIPGISGSPADVTYLDLNAIAKKMLAEFGYSSKLSTTMENISLVWSIDSDGTADMKDDAFTVQVLDKNDASSLSKTEELLSNYNEDSKILQDPIEVLSNYPSLKMVTIPISSSLLPEDKNDMETFAASLGIFIQHSDGETELIKGTVSYDENGIPISISVPVNKLSTFTLVQSDFNGVSKVVSKKQTSDKTWNFRFGSTLDTATVNENTVYVLDSNGNKVDVTVSCKGKYITIEAPDKNYSNGETYYLYFSKKIQYETGKTLTKWRRYQFTIARK